MAADPSDTGIYEIVNLVNGKRYIGSAVSCTKRKVEHFRDLRFDRHHCIALQRAWAKYGPENFRFVMIATCERDELVAKEQVAFERLKPEYNTCKVAGSHLGVRLSPEAKSKISAAMLGREFSAETRARISAALRGKPRSPETIARVAAANRGRKASDETKLKLRAARKGKRPALGAKFSPEARQAQSLRMKANPTFLGRKHTAEAKAKMSAAAKGRSHTVSDVDKAKTSARMKGNQFWLGRSHSQETKDKLSERFRGRKFTAETLAKMSVAHKGEIPSIETRQRMSEVRRGRKLSEGHKAAVRAGWARRKARLAK